MKHGASKRVAAVEKKTCKTRNNLRKCKVKKVIKPTVRKGKRKQKSMKTAVLDKEWNYVVERSSRSEAKLEDTDIEYEIWDESFN